MPGELQEGEKRLYNDVSNAEDKVHHALLDSINTKDALGALTDLMAAVNRYMLSGTYPRCRSYCQRRSQTSWQETTDICSQVHTLAADHTASVDHRPRGRGQQIYAPRCLLWLHIILPG